MTANEGAGDMLAKERVTSYIGFDPTASSLHVGSLLPIMALARLQRFGHSPIALVGGGTGMIGDPSGKSQERTLLTIDEIDANARGMRAQLERFLDFDSSPMRRG
jgi:tyrosyl-tRNA synthetase